MSLNENEQHILNQLKVERDEWAKARQQLTEQVAWNRNHGFAKLADCLRLARDHADTMEQNADKIYLHVYGILNPN